MNQSSVLVELDMVTKAFGGLRAVREVSLQVNHGEIFSVIGPNGSGKSTVFNLISGVFPVTSGQIRIFGHDTKGLRPHQVASLGVGRTFQTTQIFADKTVLENTMVGRHLQVKTGLLGAQFGTRHFRDEEARHRVRSLEILDVVGLRGDADRTAGQLPNALQQRVAIAMALANEPKLLLLDEPTAGLSPAETATAADTIRNLPRDISMLLIEHDMDVVFDLCDTMTVMHLGEVLASGDPASVRANPQVQEIYLGVPVEA
jgi:branched-chain amino acid transport system ATP-binding protein